MRLLVAVTLVTATVAAPAYAAPPVPSGPHPRLFMSAAEIAAYTANAAKSGSAAAAQIKACQDTIDNPKDYSTRGGSDGNYWPNSAVACAFAWRATQQMKYLTQAIYYWQHALDDDQTIGDQLGCTAGVSTDWQSWAKSGSGQAPAIIRTITHDTDYPMRWYGPDIALTYDWLSGAPGVSDALLSQTRTCLTAWNDFYTGYGYHNAQAGANYNAGFIIAKALGAIAIGNDGGSDGHLWNEVVDDQFGKLLVGQGLATAPAGAMLDGDWLEGWQYGELSVLEYAISARALESQGAPLPAFDAWASSLVVRYLYGTVPTLDGMWVGGDFDSMSVYQAPSAGVLDAVLAGPSSDQAASWAASLAATQQLGAGSFVYDAIAEARTVTPADYRAQMPAPPLWYLSRGSRTLYARSSWDQTAFWAVFSSPPHLVDDHEHFAASNFVFSRGGDHLIVDPSEYGASDTIETNAVSADSPQLKGNYAKTQGPWSKAELPWARAGWGNVFAARSDFAQAFIFSSSPSDIPYAHREWVFLPEGELVTIDRVHTADAAHNMYVNFHVNSGGTLALSGDVATGTVGGSQVAIHAVKLSSGTPAITQPAALSTDDSQCPGSYPDGSCNDARFPVDIYSLAVPGPYASAVHVIDGLGQGETATVKSLDDATIDPGAADNAGVLGAAVTRAGQTTYVVASSAHDGQAPATLSYGVPGDAAARHIVFDAPEAQDGSSSVTATAKSGRCEVSIIAGSGGGFAGHPVMFDVATAANHCAVMDAPSAPSAMSPAGGGVDGGAGHPGEGGNGAVGGAKGCGCELGGANQRGAGWLVLGALLLLGAAWRRHARG